jgi:hypothetical protein
MTNVGEHDVARSTRKPNGSASLKAERNRIIAFLRYALDDVGAISDRGAHHLRLAIEALEEEARKESTALGVHEVGGT